MSEWGQMPRNAERELASTLAERGVTDVKTVVGFVLPRDIAFWLVTATDAERDRLRAEGDFRREIGMAMGLSGFDPDDFGEIMTSFQSQETVDRDFEGSWFYALR
jgi:hypothetical protein